MNGPSLSYTDLNAMAQMKAGSQADSPENMERVARQFESLVLNVMLKSMRDANQVFAEGNPLNSPQTRFYQDMYDNQMAVHLAEKQGMGLADVMLRQLQPSQARPAPAVGAVASGSDAGERADQSALLARRRLAIRLGPGEAALGGRSTAEAPAAAARDAAPATRTEPSASWQPLRGLRAAARSQAAQAAAPTRFPSPEEFAAAMLPMAEKAASRLGVDAHYLVAQAALETGWGKSIIRNGDGSTSYNLFGIKSHGQWQGNSAEVQTTEYRDGVQRKERAEFRSYASYEESFNDYVDFLHRNGRYSRALQRTDNGDTFFRELQAAGYATDPRYASKVSQIARKLIGQNIAAASQAPDNQGRV